MVLMPRCCAQIDSNNRQIMLIYGWACPQRHEAYGRLTAQYSWAWLQRFDAALWLLKQTAVVGLIVTVFARFH